MKVNKIKKVLNIKNILLFLDSKRIITLNDEKFLKCKFERRLHYKLDLKNPKTFNEKIQWLKLYDRNPEYTKMVDKYEVKKIIEEKIGKKYIIPTIGVYDKFDDIDFENLPNKFVIKCTHDSGSVVICKNKKSFNIDQAREKIERALNRNFFYPGREWVYKNVTPRIIVEKYLEEENGEEIKDYKFFCFNGTPKIMYISEDSMDVTQAKISFFDMDFKLLPIRRSDHLPLKKIPDKPVKFDKMVELAKKLSSNIPHVRIDFYNIGNNIYFSEFTFYTCAGYIPFDNEIWDKNMGDLLNLPKEKKYEK